ncbi:MAG: cell division protein SepF, partial [Lactobacillus sp.]|nr:cell division protein SepF [Lactobacillus sp.]
TPKNYEISGSLTSNLKNDGDKF